MVRNISQESIKEGKHVNKSCVELLHGSLVSKELRVIH